MPGFYPLLLQIATDRAVAAGKAELFLATVFHVLAPIFLVLVLRLFLLVFIIATYLSLNAAAKHGPSVSQDLARMARWQMQAWLHKAPSNKRVGQILEKVSQSGLGWAGFERDGGRPWNTATDPSWRLLLPEGLVQLIIAAEPLVSTTAAPSIETAPHTHLQPLQALEVASEGLLHRLKRLAGRAVVRAAASIAFHQGFEGGAAAAVPALVLRGGEGGAGAAHRRSSLPEYMAMAKPGRIGQWPPQQGFEGGAAAAVPALVLRGGEGGAAAHRRSSLPEYIAMAKPDGIGQWPPQQGGAAAHRRSSLPEYSMAGPGGIGRWLPLQESACRRRSYAAPEASCSLAEAAGDAIRVPGLQAIVGAGSSSGQPASAALMWGKIPPCVGVPRASPPAPTTAGGTPRLLSPVGPSISTQQQGEAVSPTTAALTLSPRRVSQQQQLDPAAADAIHDYPLPFPSAGAAGDAVQASAAQGVLHLRCHGSVAVLIEQALVMAADLRVSACVCALSFGQSYVPPSRCILIRLTMCINVCSAMRCTMCTPTPSRHFHLRIHSGR